MVAAQSGVWACLLGAVAPHEAAAEADRDFLQQHVGRHEEGGGAGQGVNQVLPCIRARHGQRQLRSCA